MCLSGLQHQYWVLMHLTVILQRTYEIKKQFILQQKYCQNFRVNFMKVKILTKEKVNVAFYIN